MTINLNILVIDLQLTVVQTLDFDPVEVQWGGHTNMERAFRDWISSVTNSYGHGPLMVTQTGVSTDLLACWNVIYPMTPTCCTAVYRTVYE